MYQYQFTLQQWADECIKALHNHNGHWVVPVMTGAGFGIPAMLWSQGGMSNSVAGFLGPYAQHMSSALSGAELSPAVSEFTAIRLAHVGYFSAQRAIFHDSIQGKNPVGLGLTAAVSTTRERKGADHVWLACKTNGGIHTAYVTLAKGHLNRSEQGSLVDLLGVNMILWACGLGQIPINAIRLGEDGLQSDQLETLKAGHHLMPKPVSVPAAQEGTFLIDQHGQIQPITALDRDRELIFAGSFNPAHFGHFEVAMRAQEILGRKVVFEITTANPDKKGITSEEAIARAAHLRGFKVIVSNIPLYVDKAEAYRGCPFVVGGDTFERILQPHRYGGQEGLDAMLARLRATGSTFYVFPRFQEDRVAGRMEDLPVEHRDLFRPLQGQLWDISSTKIRNQ